MGMMDGAGIYFSQMVLPWLKIIGMAIAVLVITVPIGYYFFVVKRRRRWYATIWERRGEKEAIIVGNDLVIERRIPKRNAHVYELSKTKYKVPPVEEMYIKTLRGKNYVHYLRQGSDYIPMKQDFVFDDMIPILNEDGTITESQSTKRIFTPMPYEVMMQMLNLDQSIEAIWADKVGFLEKYKELLTILIIGIIMIVLMSQYFDFVAKSLEPLKETTGALQSLATTITGK